MNSYEQKIADRKARQAERARRLAAEADATCRQAVDMLSHIPPGQPILIGHHSERRHRRDLERSDAKMRKSIELAGKAEHYARMAETESNAISSDDPDALVKLREKLAGMEARRDRVKEHNRKARAEGREAAPAWSLSNLGANIRRVKQRIAQLEATAAAPAEATEERRAGVTVREDPADNRILVIFDEKPPREICRLMRSRGFKWSPTRGAWIRMLNNAGRYAASTVLEAVDKAEA